MLKKYEKNIIKQMRKTREILFRMMLIFVILVVLVILIIVSSLIRVLLKDLKVEWLWYIGALIICGYCIYKYISKRA